MTEEKPLLPLPPVHNTVLQLGFYEVVSDPLIQLPNHFHLAGMQPRFFKQLSLHRVQQRLIQPYAALRYRQMSNPPEIAPLMLRGVIGAFIGIASFGAIMLATRLDKVGEAAVLRETSTVFAALIGWIFLKETVGPRRIALMGLIALGAVIVELGG